MGASAALLLWRGSMVKTKRGHFVGEGSAVPAAAETHTDQRDIAQCGTEGAKFEETNKRK